MHFIIPSDEGLDIRGSVDAPQHARALLFVVHGFKGFMDWGFFPWLSETLCAKKIAVCRFNMSRSGVGESLDSFDRLDLFAADTYSRQLADLRTVIRHIQPQYRGLPVFVMGHSRGGGIALLAAEEIPELRGVITWSAISRVDRWDEETVRRWRRDGYYDVENARTKQMMRMLPVILDDYEANRERLDILAAASRLRVPLLTLHGARDESVPVSESHAIAERNHAASLVVIARASHTYNAIHPLVHVPFELSMAAMLTTHFIQAWA